MPCDFGRPTALRLGLTILQAMLLAFGAAGQASSQQERDRPAARPRPANPIDRWNQMSPEERERELEKLPPARARMIRQRLRRYNQMHPEERQALRQRYQTFSQLPPDKQQIVRERLRELRQLPLARRPVVRRAFEQLRILPEAQRQARMNRYGFRTEFSRQEQQIIRDLATYLPK